MTLKGNQQIPHNHFRKDWQRYVRVHFDQPGQKVRRRKARAVKAAKVAPRPVDKLRPEVRCPTVKYNRRLRSGRGFSFQELKAAGIPRKLARTIGIAVDPRAKNLSEESLARNVARLKEYKDRVIIFPRRNGKSKAGDASQEEVRAVKEGKTKVLHHPKEAFPISREVKIEEAKIADQPSEENAYRRLRIARSDARLIGVREKRAKIKAEEAAALKK